MKALVVEDDRILSNNICKAIGQIFEVTQAFDGNTGLNRLLHNEYDILITDVLLPSMDGITMVRKVRERGNNIPILMLTALDQVADKVCGLKAGADDYLAKPFDIDELLARIEALVRRSKGASIKDMSLHFLDLELSLLTRKTTIAGEPVPLSGKQIDLLAFLIENKNTIVHKENIFKHIWGEYSLTCLSSVEVYASQIRKILKQFGYDKYLKTVRGLGYIFTDNEMLL